MEHREKINTQPWRAIVSTVMVLSGCACFVLGCVCSMILAKDRR